MKRVRKGQNCFSCSKCDGFACYAFDKRGHWLDGKIRLNGKKSIRKSKKELKFITFLEFGRKYCRFYAKRNKLIGITMRDFPNYISSNGKIKMV